MSEKKAFFLAMLFGAVMAVTAALFALQPKAGSSVVVLTSPFAPSTAFGAVIKADGALIAEGLRSFVAIAAPPEGDKGDFVHRLYTEGALLVLDGSAVVACLALA